MVIKLEGRVEEIRLDKLSKSELQRMLNIALEFENYEMCAHLKKFIDKI